MKKKKITQVFESAIFYIEKIFIVYKIEIYLSKKNFYFKF